MSDTVKDKVIHIIARQAILDVSDISLAQTFTDLGIDSLGMVEMIFAVEETFDVDVPFNANEPTLGEFDISSVASVIEGVEKLLTDQAA